ESWHWLGHPIAYDGDDRDCDDPSTPNLISKQQIERHRRGNNCSANIHRKHRTRPLHEVGHSIAHAKKIDGIAGEYLRLSPHFSDRDIEVAADERAKKQCKSCSSADTSPHLP